VTVGIIYSADFITKLFLDCFTNTKGRLFRWSALVDDFIMIIYTVLLPVIAHDPALHFCLLVARDFGIAVCADLIRIYFWPDNLHNRKRVANFQNILDAEGIWIWAMMFKTPICRALCEHLCVINFIKPDGAWTINRILLFPIKVTVYEIITDFFYYWMHRSLHENKWLYRQIHKLHHRSKAPTAINSSTMSVSETFLTFLITDLFVPCLLVNIWPFDLTEFAMYAAWICAIEVYGHSGQILGMDEASVWRFGMSGLLSTFGIRLATRDHELHHWNNTCNYSKRTQVWDKVFGTFDYLNQEKASQQGLEEDKKE
jgi:sterol desaturase/sphingolipid hydroxylase (fatty acid hydroxylase superfamily)